ncbi:putative serine/threonine-protein kinase nek2 [Cucumis melo var. makuwa]|uniref:Serine/threonine-protein kinase nek2 n=1 Tax=Cucumis melo var. makuwa TaxID=1194695 RepID=A0A5A7T669_CUCMM|nr:putative serine/threonine-protein kinase nek2 [Cucumis melo var. makuwa]TYK06553.1 putative serine/threonine-protein kinase nek2 [Cucumis melo var. makuwa]
MKLILIELKYGRKLELTNKDSMTMTNIQQVVHKIDEISMNTDSSSVNRHYSNDVLTQALGTKEHNGRVRGVGEYITPTTPIMLEGIEEKGKRVEVESMDKPKENEKKGKEVVQMNEPEFDVFKKRGLIKMPTEREVVRESTSTLPLVLKSIL